MTQLGAAAQAEHRVVFSAILGGAHLALDHRLLVRPLRPVSVKDRVDIGLPWAALERRIASRCSAGGCRRLTPSVRIAPTKAADFDATSARLTAGVGSSRAVRSDDEVREALCPLLFGWHHDGIRRTGEVYPLGAFLLVGATVDVLACFAYNPDEDRSGIGGRYKRFVQDFFPPLYARLGKALWEGLRSTPLHYFTTEHIAFADRHPEAELHLTRLAEDRVVLYWPQFLTDYEAARDKYWSKLADGGALMENARARLERRPPMTVASIPRGLTLPLTLPATFPPPATLIV